MDGENWRSLKQIASGKPEKQQLGFSCKPSFKLFLLFGPNSAKIMTGCLCSWLKRS